MFAELQNHRMVQVGGHLVQHPCSNRATYKQVVRDCVQMAFEYLQGQRLLNLSGEPMPVLSHPHGKNVFSDIQTTPLVFHFVPRASDPVTGHY